MAAVDADDGAAGMLARPWRGDRNVALEIAVPLKFVPVVPEAEHCTAKHDRVFEMARTGNVLDVLDDVGEAGGTQKRARRRDQVHMRLRVRHMPQGRAELTGRGSVDRVEVLLDPIDFKRRGVCDYLRERVKRYDNARALQRDAIAMAIKAFGGADEASAVALPGEETGLAAIRVLEDAAIEYDARWIDGWTLVDADLTGRATFERRGESLDVFTANKRPLEELLGVDLIYLNEARGALVLVQYKMLEPDEANSVGPDDDEGQEWIARVDDQFKEELSRMRKFDRDIAPNGPYRLSSGAFFFKLVRRYASTESAGMLLSLGHFDQLLAEGGLQGPRGGLRISYRGLDGHYLRGEGFVELVRSGYIGTRGATTQHLQTLINASLKQGKAVVAGIQQRLP